MFSLAYRMMGDTYEASDVAQDAFITAYRKLGTYRGGNFRSWLLRICTNLCYDAMRREKRRPTISMDELAPSPEEDAPLPDPSMTPEQIAERREMERAVQACISALSPDQRVVLVLSDIEGFDYQSIADQLDTALGTVKSRLSRARASIRECLQSVGELLPAQFRL
ncbi:MAG: ECF subfamily RNA polymerase sigma-24 factor [Chloroflexi bacterium OLB15]|nr:MAG: ECF subfamily RNA polymerase sigma-24 factor [Chloroflexi bacterium OLB15]